MPKREKGSQRIVQLMTIKASYEKSIADVVTCDSLKDFADLEFLQVTGYSWRNPARLAPHRLCGCTILDDPGPLSATAQTKKPSVQAEGFFKVPKSKVAGQFPARQHSIKFHQTAKLSLSSDLFLYSTNW